MKAVKRGWLLLLGLWLCHAHAFAYTKLEAKWNTLPVAYVVDAESSIDLGASATLTVVAAAYATWSGPMCTSFRATSGGTVSNGAADASDDQNTIVWRYDTWPPEFGGSSVIGVTAPVYVTSGNGPGALVDADIQLNGVDYRWTTNPVGARDVDAQSILTHEIGHQLGLGHSRDVTAVMYAEYQGTPKRSLANDDIRGVCDLYPPVAAPECAIDADCTTAGEICAGGQCVAPPPPAGDFGESCLQQDCKADLYCLGNGAVPTVAICTRDCSAAAPCPSGYDCTPLQPDGAACTPQENPPGTAVFGEACQSANDCAEALCIGEVGASTGLCSQACATGPEATCPSGYDCAMVETLLVCVAASNTDPGVDPDADAGGSSDADTRPDTDVALMDAAVVPLDAAVIEDASDANSSGGASSPVDAGGEPQTVHERADTGDADASNASADASQGAGRSEGCSCRIAHGASAPSSAAFGSLLLIATFCVRSRSIRRIVQCGERRHKTPEAAKRRQGN